MIKAVIFDMDGVISDTPRMGATVQQEVQARFNIKMTVDEILKEVAGIPDPIQFKRIFERYGVKADLRKVIDEKWEKMKINFKNNPQVIEGAVNLIKKLNKADLSLAVASSSRLDFIYCVLETLGIKENFKVVVAGNDLKRGKPEPDIFLLAAKELKEKPEECLVIEDAPAGASAAKAAGMQCIAITTTHTRDELKDANEIINSFSELTIEGIKGL